MPRQQGLAPQEFVEKWRRSKLKERASSQEHFIDLCRLIGHRTPAEADPEGKTFTFEKGADKSPGGQGWADVWKKGCFAWEYKGKRKNLDKAYEHLQLYRDALLNPPLLIVSDMETIVIHTHFTNAVKRTIRLALDDLATGDGLDTLRDVFERPERLRAEQTTENVTQQAAAEFGKLAASLRTAGNDPETSAHFLIRMLFCLFAEDIGLLPARLFTNLIDATADEPERFHQLLSDLFDGMSSGGHFMLDRVPHFNGGIFDSSDALALSEEDLLILARVAQLDWSSIEPSIFGTLFERGLDPGKRAQLGAHYTGRDDILLLVEPVLMRPLRRRWEQVQAEANELASTWKAAGGGGAKTRAKRKLERTLHGFADEVASTRVLDPACGSGNFLYVALRQMLNLEKDVILFATKLGLPMFFPSVSPEQLYGIEINEYAHELAQATVWIGYIQWLNENGFGRPTEPILKALDHIERKDAILAFDEGGNPVEPDWPEVDVAIGNPPFLGGSRLRSELGDTYVGHLFRSYGDRIPNASDLCCYWFEKSRVMIESGKLKRVGLLATQGIRGSANRRALERIKETGDIFWAESDRDWLLDGAAVHVSMVGFDDASEDLRVLDGTSVEKINSDLTAAIDLTQRERLGENARISFKGPSPAGPFDVDRKLAHALLATIGNPNGQPNADVVMPVVSGLDITGRSRERWTIYFGDMSLEEAAQYHAPFEYVRKFVRPIREKNRARASAARWWQYDRPRPDMGDALEGLCRFVATARTSKFRLFSWMRPGTLANDGTVLFAREDDYFFGVLHSRLHELWALRQGTQLEDRPRYTPTTCFETFPFPWPPGEEPVDDPLVRAIDAAAANLVTKRDRWLNPDVVPEAELEKRTLTHLYNQRPAWLDLAHRRLDDAVLDAYGWPHDLSGDDALERLLALNLERAAQQEKT